DEYDIDSKTSCHIECQEAQPPTGEQFRLAEELGFIQFDPDLPADGLLRSMRPAVRGVAAGRPEPSPRPQQNGTVF
ncbi:MAG TPA: hypothetical protein VL329_04660, partial [Nitrospiraceae bacterium]|nr:hypothetical protein [Nitrospiraceae bacterium]